MAQVDSQNNPNDPNNPNNPSASSSNQNQQQNTNQPATSSGAGGVTATGAGNVTGLATGTNAPAQPFQNIASYLAANANGGTQLANTVAGNVTGAINQAQGDIGTASNAFNTSVNAGYTPENSSVISGVASNPTAVVAQGPQSVSDFLANYNDSYNGPTDFTTSPGYANLQSEVAAANQDAANTQTQPGVQTLLQQTEGPTATQGINNLDSLLLNLNPNSLETIQGAAAPAAALTGDLSGATTTADAQATAAQQAAQQAQTDAQAAFGTASGNLSTGVNNTFNTDLTQAQDFNTNYNDIIKDLTGTMPVGTDGGIQQLTPAQQAALGINQSSLDEYAEANDLLQNYNTAPDYFKVGSPDLNALPAAGPVSLSSFLQGGNTALLPIDASQTATPEEYAQAAALLTLSGGTYNSPLNPAGASAAGQYALDGTNQTFNQTGANAQIAAVNARDQATANDFFSNPQENTSGLKSGDYAGALAQMQKAMAADPVDFAQSGSVYVYNALNRIVNGFNAPPVGYTPPTTPPPPSLGGAGPNPNPGGGGGIVAR